MESVLEQDETARRQPDENDDEKKAARWQDHHANPEEQSQDMGEQQVEDNLYNVEYDALEFSLSDTSD